MSNLLSNNDIINLTGAYYSHFLTFAQNITVNKEPLKQLINLNQTDEYNSYQNNSSSLQNVTYIPQSGIYPAQVSQIAKNDAITYSEINTMEGKEYYRIKVLNDCYNFIEFGKTENIQYNGQTLNIVSAVSEQNFQGLKFYIYFTQAIK